MHGLQEGREERKREKKKGAIPEMSEKGRKIKHRPKSFQNRSKSSQNEDKTDKNLK